MRFIQTERERNEETIASSLLGLLVLVPRAQQEINHLNFVSSFSIKFPEVAEQLKEAGDENPLTNKIEVENSNHSQSKAKT